MLKIHIPETECFVEDRNEFIQVKGYELTIEHSLLSVSKWEAKWKKPFLTKDKKYRSSSALTYRCTVTNATG